MTEQNKTTTIPLPVQGKDMDSIMQSLESGVEELFTSNRYQEFLKTMAKFHNYSFNNTMLIAMQRPDATLVTSYKNWQSMGRQVMKGEKGITIIAPAPYKKMKEKEVLDENQRLQLCRILILSCRLFRKYPQYRYDSMRSMAMPMDIITMQTRKS